MELSRSHQRVAYTLDDGQGSETYSAIIKDIASGQRPCVVAEMLLLEEFQSSCCTVLEGELLFIMAAGRVLDTLAEAGSIVFSADGSAVLYTVSDSDGWPDKVQVACTTYAPAQTVECLP